MKHAVLSLVVLAAAAMLIVNADQTTARLGVRARVVNSCKVSTPGSVASVTEALTEGTEGSPISRQVKQAQTFP